MYRRVLRIEAKVFGTLDQYHSAETEIALANLLFELGQTAEARELLKHAVPVLAKQVPNHPILQQFRAFAKAQGGSREE